MKPRKNIYALILAGGSGTRFWPSSRQSLPKQFLALTSSNSLLVETILRIKPLIDPANIFIITNDRYRAIVAEQIKPLKIPAKNVLLEPSGKNTAPAIAWAAGVIHKRNPDAIMVTLPSDHLISNPKAYLKLIEQAIKAAAQGFLVTLGIVPTRPETGYGYIKASTKKLPGAVYAVERFVEKPDPKTALKYVKAGCYFWNSGQFVWKVETILNEMQKYLPGVYEPLRRDAKFCVSTGRKFKNIWSALPSISIDYGILEKSKNVVTIPAPNIRWSDVGSWEALWEVSSKDRHQNCFEGEVLALDCRNSTIKADERIIAAIGLENIVIVDTPDALLICRKDLTQKVKDVVDILKSSGRQTVIE